MATKQRTEVRVLPMISADMDAIMAIEEVSFQFPWTEEEMMQARRVRNAICATAWSDKSIAGFMIVNVDIGVWDIANIAVHPHFRRQGVGSQLVEKLSSRGVEWKTLRTTVRERNLAAQLFFKSLGFVAVGVIQNHYDDTDEDAYQFVRGYE